MYNSQIRYMCYKSALRGWGGGGGGVPCFLAFNNNETYLDLLSNEWGPCKEEMFNIWSCGIQHVLIKRAALYLNCNYLLQTKCIMCKNGWGPSRGN